MLVHTPPVVLEGNTEELDRAIAAVPDAPAVFLIRVREGQPYLARTNLLRRRLGRLLGEREHASRMLHLRAVATRVEYWPFASRLESSLLLYDLARMHFPENYQRFLKLRHPYFVRLVVNNPFPRTTVSTRLVGDAPQYGPFRTRAAAEAFESGFLDFFQIRRCQDDLAPSPEHPGCVYGEMGKCLRPCQEYVSELEYASEAKRVASFLETDGASLTESITRQRDRLSEALEFEEASKAHKRLERVSAILQARDELATGLDQLGGVAVTPCTSEPEAVCLWFFWKGRWHGQQVLSLKVVEGRPAPLDRRLKEAVAAVAPAPRSSIRERQDHIALLSSWYYSSWRDGEWTPFPDLDAIPYRKLVNAIHRVMRGRPE